MRTWFIAAVAAAWLYGCGGEPAADEPSAKPDDEGGGEAIMEWNPNDRGLAPPDDDPALPF